MLMKLTLPTFSAISMTLILSNSPLNMGLFVLLLSVMTLIMLSSMSSSWLAMAIFLIYVGGMLVLFAYFLAIHPNHLLELSNPTLFIASATILIMLLSPTNLSPTHYSHSTPSIHFIMSLHNYPTILLLACALLIILIVAVKLTTTKTGPLRPFLN